MNGSSPSYVIRHCTPWHVTELLCCNDITRVYSNLYSWRSAWVGTATMGTYPVFTDCLVSVAGAGITHELSTALTEYKHSLRCQPTSIQHPKAAAYEMNQHSLAPTIWRGGRFLGCSCVFTPARFLCVMRIFCRV
jgi:hypothetical protein